MIKPFVFLHKGRTYTCTTGTAIPPFSDQWWWFAVSGKDGHRYAPFRAAESDTESSVQQRIVEYYEERQQRRTMPFTPQWGRRPKPGAGSK